MMGCYDSFYAMVQCPSCEAVSLVEFQTKELGQTMSSWAEGDEFKPLNGMKMTHGSLSVYGGCCSAKCKTDTGFGTRMYADAVIKDGFFIGMMNVRKKE